MGRGEGAMIHASPDFFEKRGTAGTFRLSFYFSGSKKIEFLMGHNKIKFNIIKMLK